MTTSLVTNDSPVYYTAEAVVDTDHTITGANGRMVMYSGLTAPRTLYLPPSTTTMQTIMIMDEDGSCNLTNYINIVCDGTDKIEGNATRLINYPYGTITIESSGSGDWVVTTNPAPSLSAGMQIAPTYTDNGDGSITFTSGLYCFFTNTNGIGKIKRFNIAGQTLTMVDNTNQFIVADYNSGSPIIYSTTDVTAINETTVIPVYTIYRHGTVLHILEWDELGDALGNKTHQSIVKTQRFRVEPGGLGLGEAATRYVTVGGGTVWHGAVKAVLAAVNSSTATMWLAYHVAGVWTFSAITQYNNTQWDDGTSLQTLPGGKYAVNFIYRVVGTNDDNMVVFLGQGAYSLGEAQASQPPANLPAEVLSHGILVGRIIVSQGTSTATQIDSAFTTLFTPAGVTDHNSLLNLQGGTASQYYHLTSAEYTGTGTGNFVRLNAPTVTGTWTFQGPVTITDATASTSTTTGALTVTGGIASQDGISSTKTLVDSGTVTSTLNSITVAGSYTATSGILTGVYSAQTLVPSAASTSSLYGFWCNPIGQGANNCSIIAGAFFDARYSGTATAAQLIGLTTTLRNTSTGTVTSSTGCSLSVVNNGGGTISYSYGLNIADFKPTGATRGYAIYIAAQGTGGYAFYTAGAGLCVIGDTTASTTTATGALTVAGGVGVAGNIVSGGYFKQPVGANVASATTITPTGSIFHVTGTTAVATINLPFTGFTGTIIIIPDGLFTTTTAGNIALASTAVVSKALHMTYDTGTSKWYPSY